LRWWKENLQSRIINLKSPLRMKIRIRLAVTADVPVLRALIDASVRGLQAQDYTPSQIESALANRESLSIVRMEKRHER